MRHVVIHGLLIASLCGQAVLARTPADAPPRAATAASSPADDGFLVQAMGSFAIPGDSVTLSDQPDRYVVFGPNLPRVKVEQNGDLETGQMYVQFVKLAHATSALPLLLWHGGGSTAAIWESTPDGRPGWATRFLKAGFSLYLPDSVERGRSGFSPYPQVYKSAPIFRTKREAWEVFRIGTWAGGTDTRQAFPGHRFPANAFDAFYRLGVPRWVDNDAATQRAYDKLVRKVCPCQIIAHSQGASFAVRAAADNPGLIESLVLVEPATVPSLDKGEMAALGSVRQLIVWGDFIDRSRLWSYQKRNIRAYFDQLTAGPRNTWLELPATGIAGNSHFMMFDDNADAIADILIQWLGDKAPPHITAAAPR